MKRLAIFAGMQRLAVFARLRIGTRVYSGFTIILVLLAALGALGILSLKGIATSFATFERISANAVGVTAIEGTFTNLRRNVVGYAMTGDAQAFAEAKRIGPQLRQDIDAAMQGAAAEDMRSVAEGVARYLADFDTAATDRMVREEAYKAFEAAGAKATTDLAGIVRAAMSDGDHEAAAVAGQVQEALVLARLEAVRFASRADQAPVDAFKTHFVSYRIGIIDLASTLQKIDHKRLAQGAAQQGDIYEKAFTEFVRASFALDKLLNGTMTETADAIGRMLRDIVAKQRGALGDIDRAMTADMTRTRTTMIAIAIGAILFGLVIAWLIGRGISRPVAGLTGALKELAAGNYGVALPGLERGDEVGEMAQAVEAFKVNLADKARREAEETAAADGRAAEEKRAAAERDAARQRAAEEAAAAERKTAMQRLADEFEHTVGGIVDIVTSASGELEAAAGTLSRTAETTQQLTTVVASASEEASANVQSVASATEEMTGSIGEIGRQVQESTTIANEAVAQAHKTDQRIAELSQAASRIGDVVKLITAIAEQTNLLALNATIEAARAGEAGKGFAVVAQEVKALAGQTAKATGEIGTQIAAMQTATQDSVAAIKEIGGTITRVSQIAAAIAAAVEQQGATTGEIARNVQEAARGTGEVATNIGTVSRGASETGSAAAQVLASAQALSRESSRLNGEVDRFLQTVRAA